MAKPNITLEKKHALMKLVNAIKDCTRLSLSMRLQALTDIEKMTRSEEYAAQVNLTDSLRVSKVTSKSHSKDILGDAFIWSYTSVDHDGFVFWHYIYTAL